MNENKQYCGMTIEQRNDIEQQAYYLLRANYCKHIKYICDLNIWCNEHRCMNNKNDVKSITCMMKIYINDNCYDKALELYNNTEQKGQNNELTHLLGINACKGIKNYEKGNDIIFYAGGNSKNRILIKISTHKNGKEYTVEIVLSPSECTVYVFNIAVIPTIILRSRENKIKKYKSIQYKINFIIIFIDNILSYYYGTFFII